jgi:hypothetical protein
LQAGAAAADGPGYSSILIEVVCPYKEKTGQKCHAAAGKAASFKPSGVCPDD